MKTYVLIDFMNMCFRAKHVAFNSDINLKIGMSMHTIFNSLRYSYKTFNADHMVVCLEGRSWRKDFYAPYKQNRVVKQLEKSTREQEDDKLFLTSINEFSDFLIEKTNATVLRCAVAEADDMIACWVQAHPDDNHIIISSDSDYEQLLAPNVKLYNGVSETLTTLDGYYDAKGRIITDKKTKAPKLVESPQWMLFKKCIRGDSSDNVFSAYPGCRETGTKNQTGMREAFADMEKKGFNYNNFMLQKWVDHENIEHRVLDCYERNKKLIDLTCQPDDVLVQCFQAITDAVKKEPAKNVGIDFLRFCNAWDLKKISQYPDEFARILNSRYQGSLNDKS